MDTLWPDVRHAARRLARSPGFTATVVLTIGLGAGATTLMFSAVHGVLLKPLPYPEPERLVMVRGARLGQPGSNMISYPDYRDWRDQSRSFEALAALRTADFTLPGPGGPERIEGAAVTASFFDVLRVVPALGRLFPPDADRSGGDRVAVLGHGLWKRRFGAIPALVGRSIILGGQPYTVVGILPASFRPPREVERAEVWTPLAREGEALEQRGSRDLVALGRLQTGVSIAQGGAELAAVARRLEREHPDSNAGRGVLVESLHADTVDELRRPLLVLMGAVAFVLLIACTNVANLVLPRALARRRELAIRAALGARRSRLIRQLLAESLLLGVAGGLTGLALAHWGLDALVSLAPAGTPRFLQDIAVEGPVLWFSLALSLATGVGFGLAPALSASRTDVHAALHESSRSPGLARPAGPALIIAEIALSLVLMAGAGLMLESFRRLLLVDPGFDPHHVLTLGLSLPHTRYARPDQRAAFYAELLERVRALPGVLSAAAITPLPLGGDSVATRFTVEGQPAPAPGQKPRAEYRAVTAGYFETLHIPLKRGRTFDARDRREAPAVAVVNEALAAQVFPGENPLGQKLSIGLRADKSDPGTFEVVGVVGDVHHAGLHVPSRPEIYVPHPQQSWSWTAIVVRTSGDPLAIGGPIRREVAALDPEQAVYNVRTLSELLSGSLAAHRFIMTLLAGFALLALALATVGVYGVMAGSVERRTGEIGLRMAVGADPGDVLRMVLGQAARLAAAGVTLGLVTAFALTRVMQSLLFGVSPTDPATFAAVAGVLAAAAVLASYLPARRAARVDPLTALRYE
jgi:putative ABC transport system permease protein